MAVAVAGASGALGREIVSVLLRRGHRPRALVRDPRRLPLRGIDERRTVDLLTSPPAALTDAVSGCDAVFSAAGLSTSMERGARHRYMQVDYVGNKRLLAAAEVAGVPRFGYVSVYNADKLSGLEYVDAHQRFVEELRRSGLAATVIYANGFFSNHRESLRSVARWGRLPQFGDGAARSNPIHEADLAEVCVEALEQGAAEVEVGGPETFSRRQEHEMVFAALGRTPRLASAPVWAGRLMGRLLALRDPRRAAMLSFLVAVTNTEMAAPQAGARRLPEYLQEVAAAEGLR